MNQTKQPPLAGRPRRRSWLDILLLQPLSTSPQVALVLTRRGRVFSIIPAGSTRVISDYFDWPCEIIEVDARERQLALHLPLESRDSGRCFQASIQIVYSVVRPERVALEIDDALGELERTITAAAQITARSLTIDHPATLKESILELLQRGGSLAIRIASLGLALRRADITVDIGAADREFAERLYELQRERSFACRILAESLDPRISFEVQVASSYRYRSRVMLNSGVDDAEFTIREIVAKSMRRVSIEYAPHEYREAAHAMTEALRSNPILNAELAAAELELIRPVVDIHPARPMLTAVMQARLLPTPAYADDDPFERMLPTITTATTAPQLPIITPPPAIAAAPTPIHAVTSDEFMRTAPTASVNHEPTQDLWNDDESDSRQPDVAQLEQPAQPVINQLDETDTSGWRVDTQLFGSAPTTQPEPLLPSWLQGWSAVQREFAHDDVEEMAEEGMAEEAPEEMPEEQADWFEEETIASNQAIPNMQPIAPVEAPSAAFVASVPAPAAPILSSAAQDIAAQISRWLHLLRSDGDEEFERLALVIMEQPDRLPAVLNGLIRDPAILRGANNPPYQRCLADELSNYIQLPSPPAWLAEAPTEMSDISSHTDQQTLPEWLRVR
ncbi:MAG: hypothetical protein SH847_08460 [Roseiflexaceae bacterium]|nr:hypothetical protein [Roseiflexaceae bacterium]